MDKNKQMSERFLVGAILTFVGGFLDAYTYIGRGGVFANAQTGNVVLLGISIANGNFSSVVRYLIPIIAFVMGILIAELIRTNYKYNPQIHWRQIIIAFEMVVLVGIAFLPQGGWCNIVANVMVSFVCSLQVQSFRKFNGNLMTTTMCTGNLRIGCEHLYNFGSSRSKVELYKCLQYFGIILIFIIGATIGAILTNMIGIKTILISCIGLVSVFLLMFINEP